MGQDTGCNFTRRSRKKRVAPLIGFSIQSTDIPALNGHYKLGADINITSLGAKQGDSFRVIMDNPEPYDLGSVSDNDGDILTCEVDELDLIITFVNPNNPFKLEFTLTHNDDSDYTVIFNLINN